MMKIRYHMKDEWEFRRLVRYLREYHDELAAAGKKMLEDLSDLL